MKQAINKFRIVILFFILTTGIKTISFAQDSTASPVLLDIKYFVSDKQVPYLVVKTKTKKDRKFLPVEGVPVTVFLNEESNAAMLGKATTDEKGEGKIIIPASFKLAWDSSSEFIFKAVSNATGKIEALSAELSIKKAKLVLDTLNEDGIRSIRVTALEKTGSEWKPAKDVEVKIMVKRLLGDLPVGDAESYTTDSTGQVVAEFKRDSLPGDIKGNLMLLAKTEDNDLYGNLFIEKAFKWGKPLQDNNDAFNSRSLWGTQNKTPLWLLGIAYSIIIGVWGVIIFLVFQLLKIKKIGREILQQ
ncbi:hypothetical protein FRZ67_22105 [Panacibacter ginsenosidivorans]|uniref:Uncharacterized protein n=1 Tax=Panacibacter ginsenosidivorans TaxID=1813871 RepID=A0A5B8VEM6_9BACT|nr:hypothetical protein [Panacibacter ginsenosidivorans]QEC69860.1 hypothetical protein FRZ67_22105 [Panacibacter ginsenosidivorans]